MLRGLWNRFTRQRTEQAAALEAEREQMSPSERRMSRESVDDVAADEFAGEHAGAGDPRAPGAEDDLPPYH
ncbi:MAG: hypothetical protein ACRDM1_16550 [Gaiellaceae bacterium]